MKKFCFFIIVVLLIGGFIYFSPLFERIPPKIDYSGNQFWNLRSPIKIIISDNTGIKWYRISINNYIVEKYLSIPEKKVNIDFTLPEDFLKNDTKIKIIIEAKDISKWNLLKGNYSKKEINFNIDKKKPIINIISRSYGIGRGGSALVIYKVVESNLKDTFILINNAYNFKVFPFKKDNVYIALIAWPVKEEEFKAYIVAEDKANNLSKMKLSFFIKKYKYKVSNINLKDSFINGKVKEILEEVGENIPEDPILRFKQMNEFLRNKNETLIENKGKNFKIEKINNFKIYAFKPLKNAAKMASFGDHRFYFYQGKKISESWHLGLDLASIKNAPIILSNDGKVVYADFTGIYGNVIIIYHGLGLSSLYAHCSQFFVKEGENLKRGRIIGKTGNTGAVFGDHLHFGILIQGTEVQPIEWLDKHWIKDNIDRVIKNALSYL